MTTIVSSEKSQWGGINMAKKNAVVEQYARMWPREVFDCLVPNDDGNGRDVILGKGLDLVNQPGVYVLYRDDIPYYIGQAKKTAPSALVARRFSRSAIQQLLELLFGVRHTRSENER